LVGNYRNAGSDWRPKGDPHRVKVHDFADKELGKVAPYGVYDIAADAGWVSLGITHDTAAFAVASIRTWLERIGRKRYPNARELTITADCGGSNGARVKLWKVELQKLADETGLTINVRHYPPGTSKWNKIEHRLFCRITQNWRGRPLADHATSIDLIAATTTQTGLKVEAVGAVIGLMIWLWLSTIVILVGAELDAEMEHQTARDTTTGPPKPLGARGAAVADRVGAAQH
jgi:Rhodopirellula transposase DDE domain